jgi:hypothetical protein
MWKTVAPEQQTLINLQTWLLDEERAIQKRQSENAQSHTSAFYSKSSRVSGNPGRYHPNFASSGSMSGNASRSFLLHEQHDTHFHRA